jgi:hypothetical protein
MKGDVPGQIECLGLYAPRVFPAGTRGARVSYHCPYCTGPVAAPDCGPGYVETFYIAIGVDTQTQGAIPEATVRYHLTQAHIRAWVATRPVPFNSYPACHANFEAILMSELRWRLSNAALVSVSVRDRPSRSNRT